MNIEEENVHADPTKRGLEVKSVVEVSDWMVPIALVLGVSTNKHQTSIVIHKQDLCIVCINLWHECWSVRIAVALNFLLYLFYVFPIFVLTADLQTVENFISWYVHGKALHSKWWNIYCSGNTTKELSLTRKFLIKHRCDMERE